jgi:hypothetical protein
VRRIWSGVVKITVDIENMNVFRAGVYQSLGGSEHNAAITADQQRHMSRLLQIRSHPLADLLPRDARTRPTPNGRNRMMRKVAGNCHVALIDRSTAAAYSRSSRCTSR